MSSTLYFNTDTILIGDAKNPPTIRAAPGFNGDYLVVGGQGDDDARPCGGYFGETHFSVMSEFWLPQHGHTCPPPLDEVSVHGF